MSVVVKINEVEYLVEYDSEDEVFYSNIGEGEVVIARTVKAVESKITKATK